MSVTVSVIDVIIIWAVCRVLDYFLHWVVHREWQWSKERFQEHLAYALGFWFPSIFLLKFPMKEIYDLNRQNITGPQMLVVHFIVAFIFAWFFVYLWLAIKKKGE
jgi:hypothetical protein